MILVSAAKLGFKIYLTDVRVYKIDNYIFKSFNMVLINFQIEKSLVNLNAFKNPFLLAANNIKKLLKMLFWIFLILISYFQNMSLLKNLILLPKLYPLLSK